MDRDRGHVLRLQFHAGRYGDAVLGQHAAQALLGKCHLTGLVARAIQADHQAIAEQGIVPHTGNACDVLDTLGEGR